MSDTGLTLIGAGGHARSLLALLRRLALDVSQIVDPAARPDEQIMGIPVRLQPTLLSGPLVLAIGDNLKRQQAFLQWTAELYQSLLQAPDALVDPSARFGIANQVLSGCYIGPQVVAGDNNLFNTRCIVEHEVQLGSHCHIAVAAILLGRAQLGDRCMIGAGAVVRDGVRLGNDVILGAQAFAAADLLEPGVYAGVPARKIK